MTIPIRLLCIAAPLLMTACGSLAQPTVQSTTHNADGTVTTTTAPYVHPCAQARADAARNLFAP